MKPRTRHSPFDAVLRITLGERYLEGVSREFDFLWDRRVTILMSKLLIFNGLAASLFGKVFDDELGLTYFDGTVNIELFVEVVGANNLIFYEILAKFVSLRRISRLSGQLRILSAICTNPHTAPTPVAIAVVAAMSSSGDSWRNLSA